MLSQSVFKGVSLKHPLIAAGLQRLNLIDRLVHPVSGRRHLPPMSIRVRSNGLRYQFGGQRFDRLGGVIARELIERAGLTHGSKVLEIGCGCGRFAFALAPVLGDGGYIGVDIDRPSVEAAKRNRFLNDKSFEFYSLDVHNAEYNPEGEIEAAHYRFDFSDESFDVVFLVSVFTHMLPDNVSNYISEIGRILKPGGVVMFTTFVMDAGTTFGENNFVYGSGPYRSSHKDMHEICVGYYMHFFDAELAKSGLQRIADPVYSDKGRAVEGARTDFGQDLVFARKPPRTET